MNLYSQTTILKPFFFFLFLVFPCVVFPCGRPKCFWVSRCAALELCLYVWPHSQSIILFACSLLRLTDSAFSSGVLYTKGLPPLSDCGSRFHFPVSNSCRCFLDRLWAGKFTRETFAPHSHTIFVFCRSWIISFFFIGSCVPQTPGFLNRVPSQTRPGSDGTMWWLGWVPSCLIINDLCFIEVRCLFIP